MIHTFKYTRVQFLRTFTRSATDGVRRDKSVNSCHKNMHVYIFVLGEVDKFPLKARGLCTVRNKSIARVRLQITVNTRDHFFFFFV